MNQNLLYLVARHNVDRIYGDGRFAWIDDAWVEAVVTEGTRLPGRERDHDHASTSKIVALADRLRVKR